MERVITTASVTEALKDAAGNEATQKNFESAFTPPLEGYQATYPHLISFFADKNWTHELVEVAALAVYGWMPRILKRSVSNIDSVVSMLNADNPPSVEDIDLHFVNGSIVGTSKFLHFRWPDVYPIYDSNIMRCFKNSEILLRDRNSRQHYVDFFYSLGAADCPAFLRTQRAKIEARGERWAEMRGKEMLLFLHGQSVRSAKSDPQPAKP